MKIEFTTIKGWIRLLLIAVIIEICFSNYSSFLTAGLERKVLAQEKETDENGFFETTFIEIRGPVKNLSLDLETIGTEYAEVTIVLTDEGDKYEYTLPVVKVFPSIRDTGYINIHPYGDVTEINVIINTPSEAKVYINEISVNEGKPFSFVFLRFWVILAVLSFFYLLKKDSFVHSIYCDRKSKGQLVLTLIIMVSLIIAGFFLARINPACVNPTWPHHKQYQQLAYALEQGTVKLPLVPDERLVSSENPYDTIALLVEGIPYHMDYAYYEGDFYVYFGIIPELLLYLPFYLITGKDFPNYLAGFVFYSLIVIGAFTLCREMVFRYGKKMPFIHYLILSVSICLFSQYIYMIARPDLYNVPIMAANGFTLIGFAAWLRALNEEKKKLLYLFFGSLSMALVAGCRPQMLLFCVGGIVLFWKPVFKERTLFSRTCWKETLCFVIPYILAAIPVCWYNYARFGSILEFGATYSLTSNDMNHRGFNLERIWHGLYSFLFQPPATNSSFPYLLKSNLDVEYMGKNIIEFTFGGFFAVNLLLSIILFVLFMGKWNRFSREISAFFLSLSGASLAIMVFDVNGAGVLQRYMGDAAFGFLLAAVIMWIIFLSRERNVHYDTISRIFTLFFLAGIGYSFLLIFAEGDGVSLIHRNPELYYKVAALFNL